MNNDDKRHPLQAGAPQSDEVLSAADKALLDYARESLDQEVAGLDPAVMTRLNRARQQALAGRARTPRARRRQNRRWWWPAGGLATAVAAGLAVILLSPGPELPTAPVLTDLEILASAEGVDFYEELEFYLWLAEQVDAG